VTLISPSNGISVIEAAYAMDLPDQPWLDGLAASIERDLAGGMGTCAYVYDASHLPLKVLSYVDRGSPVKAEACAATVGSADAQYVDEAFRNIPFAAASETPRFGEQKEAVAILNGLGIYDIIGINGADPSGFGVWIGAPQSRIIQPTVAARRTWSRIATHLATALRLRLTARQREAAILTPQGRIEHLEGEARLDSARNALKDAVKQVERARGPLRRRDPEGAVDLWRGLVEAQWSLVDRFEKDGKRYVVAVENEPQPPGPELLSQRERQVVAAAALGHANKVIAYQLGLKDSTVRVLLTRAMRKLDVTNRDELVALHRAHIRAAGGNDPAAG
jgi:DNA-binding CsgD family transcriptional regulator